MKTACLSRVTLQDCSINWKYILGSFERDCFEESRRGRERERYWCITDTWPLCNQCQSLNRSNQNGPSRRFNTLTVRRRRPSTWTNILCLPEVLQRGSIFAFFITARAVRRWTSLIRQFKCALNSKFNILETWCISRGNTWSLSQWNSILHKSYYKMPVLNICVHTCMSLYAVHISLT